MTKSAVVRTTALVLVTVSAAGCSRDSWPAPAPVDEAKYRQEYDEFKKGQLETAQYALPIVGTWRLAEGDTPFGSDPQLPIVLPAAAAAAHAGVFRRTGNQITVIPAAASQLRREDGTAVAGETRVNDGPPLVLGSVHFEVFGAPPDVFVSGRDEHDPALENLRVQTYPLDPKWRLAARFDAFATPKPIKIATTQGTVHDAVAVGQLVFRVNGQEYRLTVPGSEDGGNGPFFVMFKDTTNGTSTFGGYRMLSAPAVKNGEWTVLDFNLAGNPPCAYSRFTMCPLPPKENRLPIAVEGGVKRHPTARGYEG